MGRSRQDTAYLHVIGGQVRRNSWWYATAAISAVTVLAAPAISHAFPTVKSKPEIAKLRATLEDQAITCPKVLTAWYLSQPVDTLQGWKIACSNNQDYGIIRDRRDGKSTVMTWAEMQELIALSQAHQRQQ